MVRPVTYSGHGSHSASTSVASASSVGSVFFLPQYMHVSDPSYISLDAANAIVASYPPPETTRNVISDDTSVSPAGLRTVNMFLDYILHEFLARAKATSLLRLREAVALVIRTTLGTAAMVEAEQELAAYLHDSDAELYGQSDESDEDDENGESTWNLEKVWARARTKCMIYSTLGDKEEDDFEEESEEDADYDLPASKRKLSPAGAIYLTAVLEFIGEHCFLVSGRTAYHRLGSSLRANDPLTQPVPLIVEDADVKRGIAEDDLTTRIWRKWKRSEKLLTTLSEHTHRRHTEPRRAIDSRTGSETLTRLPFTPAQASKELGPVDPHRSSIVSAPDMAREESNHSIDFKSMSLPPSSPTKSSFASKQKRPHYKTTSDSQSGTVRQSESVRNIKETLGERGVMLPDSPRSSRASPFDETAVFTSEDSKPHQPSNLNEDNANSTSRPVSARGKEILPIPREDDQESEYLDAIAQPQVYPLDLDEHATVEDPLKTPTPLTTTQSFATELSQPSVDPGNEKDVVVMGGDSGLDYSVWETRTPEDQRFYFSPPTPRGSSAPSEASYQILNAPTEDGSRPPSSYRASSRMTDNVSESEKVEPAPTRAYIPSGSTAPTIPTEETTPTPPLVIVKPTVSTDEESDVIPGSWPKEAESVSQVNSLNVEPDVSDGASAHSNHVVDRIVNHFRELEKEKQTAAAIGLGLGEYGSNHISEVTPTEIYQGQGPMIINHTELTPIMESSPRESMASETASPRLISVKSLSSEDRSPPSTRHSNRSERGVGSPATSTHSANERARSSSLTSQAERLRSKFMNRNGKMSPDKDLTVDTVAADPVKMERRMKFESLIRSGETMKLTLTPTTLRTIENENLAGQHVERENRTIPEKVRQQAQENSTRELSDFLRSTGPESFLGGTTFERRGSLPTDQLKTSPPQQAIRSMPSTPIIRNGKTVEIPPVPSPKFVPRSPVSTDPEHSTLQLAAFIRGTGPTEATPAAAHPITLGGRHVAQKAVANSVHSNGDSSTAGLLRYQSIHSQRYPPSPSTSTAYGAMVDDDSDDPELSLYPGARRKQKAAPQEESLVDFLRNTGPPEPNLPPSPTTPKNLRAKFGGNNNHAKNRANMKSPEPGQPRGIDIFEAARIAPPRVMSPTPSVRTTGTAKGNYQVGGSPLATPNHYKGLNVNFPNSSFMNDDYFSTRGPRSTISRQSSLMRDPDEIQTIRKSPSRILANGNGPREAVVTRSQTTDSLADFLKNTGPADFGAPAPKAVKKSKSGFFRRLLGGGEKATRVQRSESMSGRFTPITIPANVRG